MASQTHRLRTSAPLLLGRLFRSAGRAPQRDATNDLVQELESRVLLAAFVVDSAGDVTAADGMTTLREAIEAANLDATPDQITFAPSLIGSTITLTQGQLSITQPLTIEGLDANKLTIDANGASRVFLIDLASPGSVDISKMTIRGGDNVTVGGGVFLASGSTATLRQMAIRNNDAQDGGGVYADGGSTLTIRNALVTGNTGGFGVGVYFDDNSTGTLDGVTISGNTATGNGAGVFARSSTTVLIRGSTISANQTSQSGDGWTGGLAAVSSGGSNHVTLVSTIVSGNSRDSGATPSDISLDGVDIDASNNNLIGVAQEMFTNGVNGNLVGVSPMLLPLAFYGGDFETHALDEGSPAIDAGINANNATRDGRASSFYSRVSGAAADIGAFERQTIQVFVSALGDVVDGNLDDGETTLREALNETNANPGRDVVGFRTAILDPSGNLVRITLGGTQLTISDDLLLNGPGARRLAIDGNVSSRVIFIDAPGAMRDVEIRGLTIWNGRLTATSADGAGIQSLENLTLDRVVIAFNRTTGGPTANGAGVDSSDGTLTVRNSSFVSNNASGFGGGLAVRGGATIIENTFFTSNSSVSGGGGILVDTPSPLVSVQIVNATISNNRVNSAGLGGGIYAFDSYALTNTIVAQNTVGFSSTPSDINFSAGSLVTPRNNLIGDAGTAGGLMNGVDGNLVGVDPMFENGGATRNYGGTVDTVALQAGSPAINAGLSTAATTDGRGGIFARVFGGATDIGAFEFQTLDLTVDNPGDATDGNFGTGQLTLREAIEAAANNAMDTIRFDAALHGMTITLSGRELGLEGPANIMGPGADLLTIDGAGLSRVLHVNPDAANSIVSGLAITGGMGSAKGGAIQNSAANAVFDGLHIFGNRSTDGGGGLSSNASATVRNSAFVDNEGDGYGGALEISDGEYVVENSTFSSNRSAAEGGAIAVTYNGWGVVRNSTFFDNRADTDNAGGELGGAIAATNGTRSDASISLVSNIFEQNRAGAAASEIDFQIPSHFNAAASTNNLFSDAASAGGLTNGVNGNILGVSAMLSPLANLGGPTPTHRLRPESPAINAGFNPGSLMTDQRGFARSSAGDIDIGAFEYRPATLSSIRLSAGSFKRGDSVTVSSTTVRNDAPAVRVDYYLDTNNNGIAEPGELIGSGSASPSFAFRYDAPTSLALGPVTFLGVIRDDSGLALTPRTANASVIQGRVNIAGFDLSNAAFAQGDRVTLTATPSGGGTEGRVLFYYDANGNGVVDSGDTLLGTDTDGSDGFSYRLTTAQSAQLTLGTNVFLAVASDGQGDDATPVTTNGSVVFSLRAADGRGVRGTSGDGDNHRVLTINQAGDPVAFEQEGWNAINLAQTLGLPKATGDAETWVDPKDGAVYAAYPSAVGVQLLRRDPISGWSARNLTDELSADAISKLTVFVSAQATGQVVVIAGETAGGRLLAYAQTGGTGSTGFAYRVIDISASLDARGFATPAFTEIISYRPSWDAWHLAGIDAGGDIISVWQPPGQTQWRVDNLSTITGAAPLAGGLSVILTSWNGITLTGLDTTGAVVSTWWVPQFGGDWRQLNLTDRYNGPTLSNNALTSFYTSWDAQNYAGINADGEVVVYWWVPQFGGEWRISTLTEATDDSTRITSALDAHASPASTLNVFGAAADGSVVRASWQPGDGLWGLENLTALADRV